MNKGLTKKWETKPTVVDVVLPFDALSASPLTQTIAHIRHNSASPNLGGPQELLWIDVLAGKMAGVGPDRFDQYHFLEDGKILAKVVLNFLES